jgi:hypothetical protein
MREVLPDEIQLLKAVCVDFGQKGLTVILSLAKYENHKSSLRACFARRDTAEGWKSFLEGLGKLEPAQRIVLGMLGIDLPYVVHKSDNYLTAMEARKWLERVVFKRAVSPSYFQEYNSKSVEKYEERYGDKGLDEIDVGLWHQKNKAREPRKTKRIIY